MAVDPDYGDNNVSPSGSATTARLCAVSCGPGTARRRGRRLVPGGLLPGMAGRRPLYRPGQARAYLLQIANRLACDRSRRREPQTNLDDQAWKIHEPPSPAPEPLRAAMIGEQVRLLHAALDNLAHTQQRVLLLRYYGQMEFQEIADTLQIPLNTALSHCRRGLESLRRLLVESMP